MGLAVLYCTLFIVNAYAEDPQSSDRHNAPIQQSWEAAGAPAEMTNTPLNKLDPDKMIKMTVGETRYIGGLEVRCAANPSLVVSSGDLVTDRQPVELCNEIRAKDTSAAERCDTYMNGYAWDKKAVALCFKAARISTASGTECVSSIKNKSYLVEQIRECERKIRAYVSDGLSCLVKSGTKIKSQWE